DLKLTDNTIVVFTTDNGAEVMSWPDGGSTPFRGEKDTNYEGGWRVPCLMRWPGVIKAGQVINDIAALEDMIPTFAAAAGEADLVAKVKAGYSIDGRKFKVHLDGYNLLPFLKGEAKTSPRQEFMYFSDDGELMATRYQNWKIVFEEQRNRGINVWREPFSKMRVPKLFNLRTDPFEGGDDSILYDRCTVDHVFVQVPIQGLVARWLEWFKDFPPRAKPASFSVDQIIERFMPKVG